MYQLLPNCQIIDAIYIPPNVRSSDSDALFAVVKDVTTNETKLQLIPNPQTEYWLHRNTYRDYQYKREAAPLSELDHCTSPVKDLYQSIARSLGRYRLPPRPKQILESPYLYGADLDPATKLKYEYHQHEKRGIGHYRIGMLDLETSVLGDEQIQIASVADSDARKVYCFILQPWAQCELTDIEQRTVQEYVAFADGLNPLALKLWQEKPYTAEYQLCADEKELLVRLFLKLHELKFDFLGIWNLGYDVPYLIKRLQFRGIDPVDAFAHPEVPRAYQYFNYHHDNRTNLAHFTDVWHRLEVTDYTRWYDAMCLYSRLRKVQGKETYYTLDYIGNKIIGAGKMHFGANASHYMMQTNDRVGYIVYNTIDVIIPSLMEIINNDIGSLVELAGDTTISNYAKQTVIVRDQWFAYCLGTGYVPGTYCSGSMGLPTDYAIGNIGGAVLNPNLLLSRGLPLLTDGPTTKLYKLCCDLDVTSFYPSLTHACNISRRTKRFTVLHCDGCPYTLEQLQEQTNDDAVKQNSETIDLCFGRLSALEENAVTMGHDYFNLPNFTEMYQLWCKEEQA